MKLEPRYNRKGRRADSILHLDAMRLVEDGFDPRFDLPKGETKRLLKALERGEAPVDRDEKRKVEELVWLVWVNPHWRQVLQRSQLFIPQPVLTQLEAQVQEKSFIGNVFVDLDHTLQVHPNSRSRFEPYLKTGDLFSRVKQYVDRLIEGTPRGINAASNCLRMVRVWPEKKQEISESFFPEADRLSRILSMMDLEESSWGRTVCAGQFALLFPVLRREILEKVNIDLQQWPTQLNKSQLSEKHPAGFGVLHLYLFSLTISFAEQALVDQEGRVDITLPALSAGRENPLPTRLEM